MCRGTKCLQVRVSPASVDGRDAVVPAGAVGDGGHVEGGDAFEGVTGTGRINPPSITGEGLAGRRTCHRVSRHHGPRLAVGRWQSRRRSDAR
jgi:hypothetical protein